MSSYVPLNFDIDNYLTEYKLGNYLQKIFQKDFIFDIRQLIKRDCFI